MQNKSRGTYLVSRVHLACPVLIPLSQQTNSTPETSCPAAVASEEIDEHLSEPVHHRGSS